MRILHFAEWFWPEIGGIPVVTARLVTGLRRRGHAVVVVAENDFGNLAPLDSYSGIAVHRFGLISALHARDVDRLSTARASVTDLCRSIRPDVIHAAYSPMGSYYVTEILARQGVPLLLSFHGPAGVTRDDPGTLLARTLRGAAWITACSKATLIGVRELDRAIAARSSVLYNGVETPPRPPVPPVDHPKVIAAVGRMYHQKGFDVLIDAYERVAEKVRDVRLTLVGDGPERGALERRASGLAAADTITFTGWVPPPRVGHVIDQSTLVVVPSREEGFGLSALESAIRGRPVVASRVGGLPEVVGGEDHGVLVEPERPDELSTAILGLLEDPERAANLGAASRSRAEQLFSADKYLAAHEEIYRRLTGKAQ